MGVKKNFDPISPSARMDWIHGIGHFQHNDSQYCNKEIGGLWGYILSENFFRTQDKKTMFVHFSIFNFKSISVNQYKSFPVVYFPPCFSKKNSMRNHRGQSRWWQPFPVPSVPKTVKPGHWTKSLRFRRAVSWVVWVSGVRSRKFDVRGAGRDQFTLGPGCGWYRGIILPISQPL